VRQYRWLGLSTAAAVAVTVLTSLQATAVMLGCYAVWAGAHAGSQEAVSTALAGAGVATVALVIADRATGGALRRLAGRGRTGRIVTQFVADAVVAARSLTAADWAAGLVTAAARRALDLASLLAVAHAFGLRAGFWGTTAAYLAVQLLRQIPAAAGGAGMIEASLVAALVAAGADAAGATAAVMIYRIISCWLVAAVGVGAWWALRHRKAPIRASRATPAPYQVA
jgi:uncharacterized membrane protein YbhN (UPF0104 family)